MQLMKTKYNNPKIEKRIIAFLFNWGLSTQTFNKIFTSLSVDYFAEEVHRHLFEIIQKMYEKHVEDQKKAKNKTNPSINYRTVNSFLDDSNFSDEIIFEARKLLDSLLLQPDSLEYLDFYINELDKLFRFRRLKSSLEYASDTLDQADEDNISIIAQKVNEIMDQGVKQASVYHDKLTTLGHHSHEAIDLMYKRANTFGLTGVDTGLGSLNKYTNGFQPSDLIIIAARPSMGKSALAVHMALSAVTSQASSKSNYDYGVAFFTLEMPAIQLAQRFLANATGIPINEIADGYAINDNTKILNLNEKLKQFDRYKIYLEDNISNNIEDLKAKIWRLVEQTDRLKLIVIDYIQLLSSKTYGINRQNEIAFISRTLKRLAVELKIPIVALSQLSREVEKRIDKMPIMSDLRESGAIEQDADIVMFLYREDYYTNTKQKSIDSLVDIRIAKHRNGPLGSVKVNFRKNTSCFQDLQKT